MCSPARAAGLPWAQLVALSDEIYDQITYDGAEHVPVATLAKKTLCGTFAGLSKVYRAAGYRVVMTRESDVFVPLATRVAMANAYRNAIFVCIHFNSARRSGASGIETYFYSSQSLPLASAIHYCLSHAAPSSNRGVRRRGYYVLRRTTVPAVLVECGFLTNPTEAQYAQSGNYRQMLAEQIARGVRSRSLVTMGLFAAARRP